MSVFESLTNEHSKTKGNSKNDTVIDNNKNDNTIHNTNKCAACLCQISATTNAG